MKLKQHIDLDPWYTAKILDTKTVLQIYGRLSSFDLFNTQPIREALKM